MQSKDLYKYINGNSTVISLTEPSTDYTSMKRLIADAGKALFNGTFYAGVVDVEEGEISNWSEVGDPELEDETDDMKAALETLGVVVDG